MFYDIYSLFYNIKNEKISWNFYSIIENKKKFQKLEMFQSLVNETGEGTLFTLIKNSCSHNVWGGYSICHDDFTIFMLTVFNL